MNGAFVLPDAWRAVRLVLVRPPLWPHAAAVAEVMELLVHGLCALGIRADAGENEVCAGAVNIFFMAHVMAARDAAALPPNSVIYNFEQVGGTIDLLTPAFRAAVARCRVWDYSARNLRLLAPLLGHDRRQVVPLGYAPALSRIQRAPVQDIDVLFYGAVNERRRDILLELQQSGLRVQAAFGVYGAERDALTARAKVVLNMHAQPTRVLEVVRISYLLANRKAVVSELDGETEADRISATRWPACRTTAWWPNAAGWSPTPPRARSWRIGAAASSASGIWWRSCATRSPGRRMMRPPPAIARRFGRPPATAQPSVKVLPAAHRRRTSTGRGAPP